MYFKEFNINQWQQFENININFENRLTVLTGAKFEELLYSLNIDYEETLYKLNNRFINQLRDNKYYKFSIKYIIFDKIYNEIINKILSIYLNPNVNVEDERQLLKGIQKIQKISLIKHLKETNINVPNDIIVAGFDNHEISEMIRPKITTVAQPFYEMGKESAKALISIIRDEDTIGKRIYLNHELFIRESTIV